MDSAYTWEQYWYAVNDWLLAANQPVLCDDDKVALQICYHGNTREFYAYKAIVAFRKGLKDETNYAV